MTDKERIERLERKVEALEKWIQEKGAPAIRKLQEQQKAPTSPTQDLYEQIFKHRKV